MSDRSPSRIFFSSYQFQFIAEKLKTVNNQTFQEKKDISGPITQKEFLGTFYHVFLHYICIIYIMYIKIRIILYSFIHCFSHITHEHFLKLVNID